MSSRVRSIEEAAEQTIDTLKHFLQINTMWITADNGQESRLIRAFNRHEDMISHRTSLALLQSYSDLISAQPDSVLIVSNVEEDERTAGLPLTAKLGPCSIVGLALTGSERQAYGTLFALDRKPIDLDDRQIGFLKAVTHFLGYMLELENASVTDSLTGVFNRRYLHHLYQNESDKAYSVMFIDIDDFKEVNDSFGHDFGDRLLLEMAARLKQIVRKTDFIVRYGGDEFIICFPHLIDKEDIDFVADKIKESIIQPFCINGQTISVSASIGISANHGEGASLKKLISDADLAMYDMKLSEKNS